jgi:hypothetical protein
MSEYQQKYLKYKNKYLELKNNLEIQKGGLFNNQETYIFFYNEVIYNKSIENNIIDFNKFKEELGNCALYLRIGKTFTGRDYNHTYDTIYPNVSKKTLPTPGPNERITLNICGYNKIPITDIIESIKNKGESTAFYTNFIDKLNEFFNLKTLINKLNDGKKDKITNVIVITTYDNKQAQVNEKWKITYNGDSISTITNS